MKLLWSTCLITLLFAMGCSKSNSSTVDAKTKIVGNWFGNYKVTVSGSLKTYPVSQTFSNDNSTVQIDSLSGNPPVSFPGTYTYTNDSIFITFNNGTKYRLGFSSDYTNCSGTGFYIAGSTGPVTLTKRK
jgi:hypothetical protein